MPPAGGMNFAVIAQQVERILGKDEVPGSNPGNSSIKKPPGFCPGAYIVYGTAYSFSR